MTKSGITTSYLIELSPEEMVVKFSEAKWNNLELSSEHSETLLERGDPLVVGKEFNKFAEQYGVDFPQGHLWLSCDLAEGSKDEKIGILKRWLDLYMALEIKAAVLHPGGWKKMKSGEWNLEQSIMTNGQMLRILTEHIKGSDLYICLENIPPFVPEIEDVKAIIDEAGCNNIGICLDTGHLHLSSGDQIGFIRAAGKYLRALHIQDNLGKKRGEDDHIAPYGLGTIEWNNVIKGLKEINYEGLFALEISGERKCPMPVKISKLGYLKFMADYMVNQISKE